MRITYIRKRTGQVVPFNKDKIINAIMKAAKAVGGEDASIAEGLAEQVMKQLEKTMPLGAIPNIEDIQDIVEKVLIENGHAKTAKAYIVYRQERAKIREQQKIILGGKTTKLPFSMNALQVVAKRYLVRNRDGDVIESPEEMFQRVASALASVESDYGKTDDEIRNISSQFYDIMSSFEFTPAGRTLSNAGAPTRNFPISWIIYLISYIFICICLPIRNSNATILRFFAEVRKLIRITISRFLIIIASHESNCFKCEYPNHYNYYNNNSPNNFFINIIHIFI